MIFDDDNWVRFITVLDNYMRVHTYYSLYAKVWLS